VPITTSQARPSRSKAVSSGEAILGNE